MEKLRSKVLLVTMDATNMLNCRTSKKLIKQGVIKLRTEKSNLQIGIPDLTSMLNQSLNKKPEQKV
jgi:hypothetical protein